MAVKTRVDMTTGPIFSKLLVFSLPLIAINIINQLFHAADVAVVGIFGDDFSVAAISSTGALTQLVIGLFTGLSVGANVLIAKYIGAKDLSKISKTVSTSIIFSIVAGVFLTLVFQLFTYQFLTWMGNDPDVIDLATTYLKTYALGMPIVMLYTFGGAMLRAMGDSIRPMVFVLIGGVVNVILNVVFVVGFNMVVEGVAIATVVSNLISAVLMMIALFRKKDLFELKVKDIRFDKESFIEMVKIGVPSGIQGMCFSISNVIIQSTVNSFGDKLMTAQGAAAQIEAFIYNIGNGIYLGTLPFVSQNYGARNYERLKKIPIVAILIELMLCIPITILVLLFARPLISIFTSTPEVQELALIRMFIIGSLYFTCGIYEILSASMRGVGRSTSAMIITIFGTCILRIIYATLIFPTFTQNREAMLYLIYPISWVVTSLILLSTLIPTYKRIKHMFNLKNNIDENISKTEQN